jgi:type I restriction enzyme S subunit
MAFNQSCYGIIAREQLDQAYAYYLLKYEISNLKRHAYGSVFDTITRDTFSGLYVNIPPLLEQQRIAEILGALDDKIELNLEINKNLEEIAMLLYKRWFVDFEFPDEQGNPYKSSGGEMVESELGMIPKGWKIVKIDDATQILGGGTPKTSMSEFWDGEILWYTPTDVTRQQYLYTFETGKKITEQGLQKSSARIFPKNSLLMTSRATIGAITINVSDACTNQGFINVIPGEDYNVCFLHNWMKSNMEEIFSRANGSTFKEISKANFRTIPVFKTHYVKEFGKQVHDLYELLKNAAIENQTLTKIRDLLLPKLISGEIRIRDAEKKVSDIL